MEKTFIDLIAIENGTDHIIASMGAYREEHSTNTVFQFKQMRGLDVKEGMVVVCDTGRYTIIGVRENTGICLEVLVNKAG